MANRIIIGITNPAIKGELLSILGDLGVPTTAVRFREKEHLSFNASNDLLLYDYIRPVVGGISLVREGETSDPHQALTGCSVGVLAKDGSQRRLITASHCSHDTFATDYMWYFNHRAFEDSIHYVGLEYYDPKGYSCHWWQYTCRNSDAGSSSVSGGSSPYTYEWRRDDQVVSTSSSYETFDTGDSNFVLELTVWDSDSGSDFDVLQVTVQGSGQFQCV